MEDEKKIRISLDLIVWGGPQMVADGSNGQRLNATFWDESVDHRKAMEEVAWYQKRGYQALVRPKRGTSR